MSSAPQLVKTYEKEIAGNSKVEFIHASLDRDANVAKKWAKSANFPWLTVLNKDLKKSGLQKYMRGSVPHYVLIDKNGKKVTEGKVASFNKIQNLGK